MIFLLLDFYFICQHVTVDLVPMNGIWNAQAYVFTFYKSLERVSGLGNRPAES